MIQRIQSFYFLLTTLLSLLFLKGSFLNFIDKSGSVLKITFRGIIKVTGAQGSELIEKFLPLSAIIFLIPALALITLFLYKNRKLQLWFAFFGVILATGLLIILFYYSYTVITKYGAEINPGLRMIIPVLILVFAILAFMGIRKDDHMIKSYDRLR